MNDDYSYLGSGKFYLREYGSAAPFIEVGNCSALSFNPQVNSVVLADYRNPGGGTRNRVDRVTECQYSLTLHDFSPENLARFLRGSVTDVAGGTATEEEVVAYKGGFTPLDKVPTAITSVKSADGLTTYDAGEDYQFVEGGIFIPSDSGIANPVSGAANIKVTYTYPDQAVVQALVTSAKNYEALFVGMNEARGGSPVRIRAHKISGGVLDALQAIGDQHGAGTVTGALQADPTKGVGLSKFFHCGVVK